MNWIKQNNILAAIAAIALIGSAIFGWLAYSNLATANKSVSKYKSASGELGKLYAGQLYPTTANLKAKSDSVKALSKETQELRAGLVKQYGAAEGGDPATFGQRAQRRFEELRKIWDAAGMKVPDGFFLGLERYREKVAAPKEAIKHLDFQLEAISYLMESAAQAGITGIERFERSPIFGEEGAPAPVRDKKETDKVAPPLQRYSMEIQCIGPEPAIRNFINTISASKRHFFAIRAIRLQNETTAGPNREEVRNKVKTAAQEADASAATDLFAGLAAAETTAPAAGAAPGNANGENAAPVVQFSFAQPGVKDAYQFLGGEQCKVVVALDLVIFEPTETPATDANQPASE